MKLERRSLSRLAVPLKALVDRFAFALLVGLSLALLILGKANGDLLASVNTRLVDALAPVLGAMSRPLEASRQFAEALGAWVAVHEENARLRAQNERLMEWQTVARQLELENRALRRLANLAAGGERPTAVAARVIADSGGPFVHTVLVNVGAEHGVVEGMAAVNEQGLVGRIIDVGRRSARLLLLIDFNSRVPVMVERSRDQAILTGDNTRAPALRFLPLHPRLAVGDRVVTSGRGGVLPPGLDIGIVSAISDEKVAVTTWVDWDRLEYLRLLDFAPVGPPERPAEASDAVSAAPRSGDAARGAPVAGLTAAPGQAPP